MEENNFERQVQQKMDELKIHPSDAVWEKIAVRIAKKKRPKRVLFLFLLFFCALLLGGYLLLNVKYQSINDGNNSEKNNSEKTTSEISAQEKKAGQAKTSLIRGSAQKHNTAGNVAKKQHINKNTSQHYRLPSAKKIIKINSGEKATVISAEEGVKDEITENTDAKPGIVEPGEIPSKNQNVEPEIKDAAYAKVNKDTLLKSISVQNAKAEVRDTVSPIVSSSGAVKQLKKNKWKPGLLFSGGISRVGNDFLGFVNSAGAADYSNVPGQGTTPGARPSATKAAFGFIAGVVAEKNISSKIILVTGINFKSFSTSNKVGTRNDTSGFYNSRNTVNTYKNNYNFIELPVTFKIQIGRGKNIPLFWQGGLVVSQLTGSNAIQFNPITGLYYNRNSIFNKTQIGLNTAFSASLFSKQKNSVLIGPYFYYGASRLASEGLYNKKHFVFTGLRTEIIFGK